MDTDARYADILLDALRVSADYLPKFGLGRRGGVSFDEFETIYGADPLYSWIGFDAPAIYAAHRAAGGMTSTRNRLRAAFPNVAPRRFRADREPIRMVVQRSSLGWRAARVEVGRQG